MWYFVTGNWELIQMGLADVPVPRCKESPAEAVVQREELVQRVASSSTFERSPRLRAFFLHACRSADVPVPRCKESPAEAVVQREELVQRVASSSTFERSPRLRAFFLHACRCALDNKPEGATEQQG